MKKWFTKFRISAALDADKPLPVSLRQKIAGDAELERFLDRTQALGRSLRNPPLADPSLHDSIMSAVRASARREESRSAPMLSWLAASGTVAALAVLFLFLFSSNTATADTAPVGGGLVQLVEGAITGVINP